MDSLANEARSWSAKSVRPQSCTARGPSDNLSGKRLVRALLPGDEESDPLTIYVTDLFHNPKSVPKDQADDWSLLWKYKWTGSIVCFPNELRELRQMLPRRQRINRHRCLRYLTAMSLKGIYDFQAQGAYFPSWEEAANRPKTKYCRIMRIQEAAGAV